MHCHPMTLKWVCYFVDWWGANMSLQRGVFSFSFISLISFIVSMNLLDSFAGKHVSQAVLVTLDVFITSLIRYNAFIFAT